MEPAQLEAEGWSRVPTSRFSAAIGPVWMRGERGARTLGLQTGDEAANDHLRSVHGGALMTFADISLGFGVADLLSAPNLTTVQMQYQFAGAARVGSFVTCEPEVVRRTSQLVFIRGLFSADGKVIGSADAIFRIFETLPPAR